MNQFPIKVSNNALEVLILRIEAHFQLSDYEATCLRSPTPLTQQSLSTVQHQLQPQTSEGEEFRVSL